LSVATFKFQDKTKFSVNTITEQPKHRDRESF